MKNRNLILLLILLLASSQGLEARRSRLYYNFKDFDLRYRMMSEKAEKGFATLTIYGSRVEGLNRLYYSEKGKYDIKTALKNEKNMVAKSKTKPHKKLTRRNYKRMAKENAKE
jgi:major membrane immunogen (membrane-anchored lipoprotein)